MIESFKIKLEKLKNLSEKLVDTETIVDTARAAKYKLYQRAGRKDRISLIEIDAKVDVVVVVVSGRSLPTFDFTVLFLKYLNRECRRTNLI